MNNTHQTAETKFVEAKGIKFAYRRFGKKSDIPVVFLQHYTGTMDNWDPMVTDGIAQNHEVIIFDNAGIGSSTGKTPDNADAMADDALAFIQALALKKVDLLGFSLGGFVSQKITVKNPALVRKLVLAGTGPRGSTGLDIIGQTLTTAIGKKAEGLVWMFFADSESSSRSGREFVSRIMLRKEGRDTDTTNEAIGQQTKAIMGWGASIDNTYSDLKAITQPVLIVNGSKDIVVPTRNSYTLYEQLSNARLVLYPDSGHGSLFQYADLFVAEVTGFFKEKDQVIQSKGAAN